MSLWFEIGALLLLAWIGHGLSVIERAILKVGKLLDERTKPPGL